MSLRNPARERLERGELALGLGLRLAKSVDIAKILKTSGYDWLFIDLEHGTMSLDQATQIAVAALDTGISPIVRVPALQHHMATRALDGGALGIVMPHVDTAEEAREIVDRLKYPPTGHRSVAGAQPQFDYRAMKVAELTQSLNAACLTIVMIETPRAVANAEAIAAVPGVDVLLIGTNDLAAEMGIPGDFANPRIAGAYETVIAACRRHGKWPGMGGLYQEELLRRFIGMGMRMVLAGGDVGMLMQAASQRSGFLRGCL
ncbi:MAG TPA: aldolase/citrate lyase family protein [Stellaceae bacterium]|nr:aldolase/citrate lyase family protein [Stellaceae bacterium]